MAAKGRYIPKIKNGIDQSRITGLMVAQRTNDMISMILEGKPTSEIMDYCIKKYGGTLPSNRVFLVQANKEIRDRKAYELDDVINSHVERYELIYSDLMKLRAHSMAMNALKAKEKLIQLHKNDTHMRVVGGQVGVVEYLGQRTFYDQNRLDEGQRERLEQLLKKIDL
jgi:hypothetical protein